MKTAKEWKSEYDNDWTKGVLLEEIIKDIQREAYSNEILDRIRKADPQ